MLTALAVSNKKLPPLSVSVGDESMSHADQQLKLSQALIQSRQRRRIAKDVVKNISAIVHLFSCEYVSGVSQITKTTYTNNKGYSELQNNLRENKIYLPSIRSLDEILNHTHKVKKSVT